jgi:hypothetical protein
MVQQKLTDALVRQLPLPEKHSTLAYHAVVAGFAAPIIRAGAECKRALQANEPIWRVRIRRLGRNIHGLPRIKTSTESICAQCASERIDLPEYSSGPCATAVAWFTMRLGDSLADTDTVANIVN